VSSYEQVADTIFTDFTSICGALALELELPLVLLPPLALLPVVLLPLVLLPAPDVEEPVVPAAPDDRVDDADEPEAGMPVTVTLWPTCVSSPLPSSVNIVALRYSLGIEELALLPLVPVVDVVDPELAVVELEPDESTMALFNMNLPLASLARQPVTLNSLPLALLRDDGVDDCDDGDVVVDPELGDVVDGCCAATAAPKLAATQNAVNVRVMNLAS